jgi:hypothetical protein
MHTYANGYTATFIATHGIWHGLIYKDGVYIYESMYTSRNRDEVVTHVTSVINNTIDYFNN